MGDVIGDLNSRRGQIQANGGAERCPRREGACAAVGDVRLMSATFGRGPRAGRTYSMVFSTSYAEVPANVSKEIIAKATGQ